MPCYLVCIPIGVESPQPLNELSLISFRETLIVPVLDHLM